MTDTLQLQKLIYLAAHEAERLLAEHGTVLPFVVAVRGDGEIEILKLPHEAGVTDMSAEAKASAVVYFKIRLRSLNATAYALATEAWMVALEAGETLQGEVSQHPQRYEVVHYLAEDMHGGQAVADHSIIRPSIDAPCLDDDLKFRDTEVSQGRFTGLLKLSKRELELYDQIRAAAELVKTKHNDDDVIRFH